MQFTYRGFVKRFDLFKGFGFIQPASGQRGLKASDEIYVHRSNILGPAGTRMALYPGDPVEFVLASDRWRRTLTACVTQGARVNPIGAEQRDGAAQPCKPLEPAIDPSELERLRASSGLPPDALIGKIVHIIPHAWGLIQPLSELPGEARRELETAQLRGIYFKCRDLAPGQGDTRLFLEQIVSFELGEDQRSGVRAISLRVLRDPFAQQRLKREAA